MRVYEHINALPPTGIGRRAPTAEAQLAGPDGKETVMDNEERMAHLVGSARIDGM